MEAVWKVIVLAIIQGLTEFLPVSSSGHLVLAKHFLGLETPGASLELFLHGGTLVAIVVYYWHRIAGLLGGIFRGERASLLYVLWVLLSMVPAGLFYVWKGDELETAYGSAQFVSWTLMGTGLFLMALYWVEKRTQKDRPMSGVVALFMGFFQMIAMLPGVSRSGSTIWIARVLGIRAKDAAEFSFIMSLPVVGGAFLLEVLQFEGPQAGGVGMGLCGIGALIAGLVGWLSIGGLIRLLGRGQFHWFGVYCFVVGLVTYGCLR